MNLLLSYTESEKEIDTLKSVMQDYVQMERDLEDFMNSVEDVTNQVFKKVNFKLWYQWLLC